MLEGSGLETDADVVEFLEEFSRYGDAAAEVVKLSDITEFENAMKNLEQTWRDSGMLTVCEWTSPESLRHHHARLKRVEVRLAMFQQAIAVHREGFDQANRLIDPYSNSEFELERSEDGFVIRSEIPHLDGNLSLHFPAGDQR